MDFPRTFGIIVFIVGAVAFLAFLGWRYRPRRAHLSRSAGGAHARPSRPGRPRVAAVPAVAASVAESDGVTRAEGVDDPVADTEHELYPGQPGNAKLTEPPMVFSRLVGANVSLREWLARYHPLREGVWEEVVVAFYTAAATDRVVASYFGLDALGRPRPFPDGRPPIDLAELQKHFLAALTMIAHTGLTVGVVRRTHDAHATVRNLENDPINGAVYERVISVLAGVIGQKLGECGIAPAPVISALATTIEPLRAAIVVEAAA